MNRRDFIAFLGGATALVAAARAQEPRRVIGTLSGFEPAILGGMVPLFRGLKDAGFVEGTNITIERRWAAGHYDRLPSLAAELVKREVAVIVTTDVPSTFAAKAATKTIPIVFSIGADPVKVGLVESFSRPNGNLTGISIFLTILGPKHVELLRELLPAVNTIAVLGNPGNANFQSDVPDIRAAADALGERLEVLTASTESDLETVFVTMVQHRIGALILVPDPFLISRGEQLVRLAARYAVPAIYPSSVFTDLGGLMSYGSDLLDLGRQLGSFVGKILKGAQPADLPIQQSTKVELVINLKTAKVLDLTIPATLLARADDVIE